MTVKCTWLFNGSQGGKSWGFSETWYHPGGANVVRDMDRVSQNRALILSSSTEIVGYRIGPDNGRAYVLRKGFEAPGSNDTSNLPVDAALCAVGSAGSDNLKRFFFHDLPDNWVTGARIAPSRLNSIQAVITAFTDLPFLVRRLNPAAITAPILSISNVGLVTTSANIALAENNSITLLNCRDINGHAVRGNFVVGTVVDATHFNLVHWAGQTVARSGRVRLVQFSFGGAIDLGRDRGIIGAASRKVGRPFFQLRGRAPIRR